MLITFDMFHNRNSVFVQYLTTRQIAVSLLNSDLCIIVNDFATHKGSGVS